MNKAKLLEDIKSFKYVAPVIEQLKISYQNDYIKFRNQYYNSDR